MKAREFDFKVGGFQGGMTLYPYQLSLGITARYYPCIFMPSIRIHLGPFKFWLGVSLWQEKKVISSV